VVAAACGTGESAIDAGRDDVDEGSETAEVVETQPTPPATDAETIEGVDDNASTTNSSGDNASDADATDADTVPPATEPPSPLADLPACPTDVLDDADGPVEITMWFGLADALADELQVLADDFNASQNAVVVNIENQVDYESTIDKYLQLDVDQRPEVLLAPEFVVQSFAESQSFVPVDACIESSGLDTSSFLPRALDAYGYDDVQWALPFNVSSPVLFYVEPTFVAAGLDPADPPLTLEELREDSETIVESGAATYGLVVDVARDSAGGIVEQWFGQAEVLYVNNDNGRSGRATEVLFDNETGLRVFTYLQELRRDDLSFNVGENPGGLDAFLKLVDPSEPGAMTIATSAALTQLIDGLDAGLGGDLTQDDLGVGPMPGPTDEPAAQVSGAALWIPAEKGDEATAAAWSFTAFLVDAQTQSTWAAGTGYVPMRSDAVELDPIATLFENDPRFKVSYDQLAASIDSPAAARPALGPQREVRQEVVDAISRLYADPDGADAEQLLGDAAETSDILIANYNDLN
jgi:sn-glycerol 3-phosphate transport system substrate-binding protein